MQKITDQQYLKIETDFDENIVAKAIDLRNAGVARRKPCTKSQTLKDLVLNTLCLLTKLLEVQVVLLPLAAE